MRILGNFPSQLNSAYYAALLALVKDQIAAGDYAGGASFDAAAVAALQAQGQDFTSLALPEADDRVFEGSLNDPLNRLVARFGALSAEVANFQKVCNQLTQDAAQQTALLDQLLAYAAADTWANSIPPLGSATTFTWNFGGGFNAVSSDIGRTDPTTSVVYPALPNRSTILDTATGQVHSGLSVPVAARKFAPKQLTWLYSTPGTAQVTYGDDWADLGILEDRPRLIFSSAPIVQPPPAADIFQITGDVPGGTVPVYVNLLFVRRRTHTTATLAAAGTVSLTSYRVEPENTSIVYKGQSYTYGVDFSVTENGTLTSIDLPANVLLDIYFDEYFPAYQCSINQDRWSQLVMLDPDRPYLDDATEFPSLGIRNKQFPLTDEAGVFTGLYLELVGVPTVEMLFTVTTPAASNYGVPADLRIDMERPAYMTGISLSPYTNFPQTLKRISCQSVTGAPVVLFSGSVLIDKPMVVSFPRTSVRSLTFSFVQEHYTFKQYTVDPPDKLRRDTINSLQPVLPFAIQSAVAVQPALLEGAQYQFGFESIAGLDWSATSVPAVFVSGPYRVLGIPELVRVDAATSGQLETWLCFRAYSSSGQLVDSQTTGVPISYGAAVPVPFSNGVDRTQVAYTDFSLRFVFRSADARVDSFAMQVVHV